MVVDVIAMMLMLQMFKTTSCYNILDGRCFCQYGRWNSHCSVGNILVGVITNVADGIATRVCFILSSEVLNRTSSHMCGRWYLPMFLLRDGLLTLMYSAIVSSIGSHF